MAKTDDIEWLLGYFPPCRIEIEDEPKQNLVVRAGVVSPRDLRKIRLDPSEFVGEDAVQPGDQLDVSGLGMLHGVAPGLYRVRSVDSEAQEVELERE